MFAGTALSVRVFVYAGLSLFIINGHYLYVVVCVLYAYNLTIVVYFFVLLSVHQVLLIFWTIGDELSFFKLVS